MNNNIEELDAVDKLRLRLGEIDMRQIEIWRAMSRARRLEIAFQAYHFALEVVRKTETTRHPELPKQELDWRITRRMQGDQSLGRTA
ncbi:MAG: hypothetical protein R3A44_17515 [Caldilineaceae bacterium]